MKVTGELLEAYAQKVVEDMDIDDLMNEVKDSIIDRMKQEPEEDCLAEIEQSCFDYLLEVKS